MAKYIDADKLKNNLLQSGAICDFGLFLIEKQPAVDVQKVKRGKWKKKNTSSYFSCSRCGYEEVRETNYCSYCGAKMDGKGGE